MPAHTSDMNSVASKWLLDQTTVNSDLPKLLSDLRFRDVRVGGGWHQHQYLDSRLFDHSKSEQLIKELVPVMASDEWTDQDIQTFAFHLRQKGIAASLLAPDLLSLRRGQYQARTPNGIGALDDLRAASTYLSAPMRHQAYLSKLEGRSWRACLSDATRSHGYDRYPMSLMHTVQSLILSCMILEAGSNWVSMGMSNAVGAALGGDPLHCSRRHSPSGLCSQCSMKICTQGLAGRTGLVETTICMSKHSQGPNETARNHWRALLTIVRSYVVVFKT